jgi:hypothetical protein
MNPTIYTKIKTKCKVLSDREIVAEYLNILKKLEMTPEKVDVQKIKDYLDKIEVPAKKKN